MKASQKKTCRGCNALREGNDWELYCCLGYETILVNVINTFDNCLEPKEPCPKPKTYAECDQCRNSI